MYLQLLQRLVGSCKHPVLDFDYCEQIYTLISVTSFTASTYTVTASVRYIDQLYPCLRHQTGKMLGLALQGVPAWLGPRGHGGVIESDQ